MKHILFIFYPKQIFVSEYVRRPYGVYRNMRSIQYNMYEIDNRKEARADTTPLTQTRSHAHPLTKDNCVVKLVRSHSYQSSLFSSNLLCRNDVKDGCD